ncbi:carbohydrate ABC transporter permease, partial [Streptomyces sp. MCAF7]
VQISLYHWDGLSASTWAGAANYAEIVGDPLLRDGFVHSLVLLLFYSAVPVAIALVLAAATTRAARMRGVSVFRALLFLPQVIAQVVTATAWTAIYAPDGVLNQFDLVYVSTHGGPGNSTSLPAFEIYNRAFNTGQVGSACAIAVALTLLILVLTFLITRLQPDESEEGS